MRFRPSIYYPLLGVFGVLLGRGLGLFFVEVASPIGVFDLIYIGVMAVLGSWVEGGRTR